MMFLITLYSKIVRVLLFNTKRIGTLYILVPTSQMTDYEIKICSSFYKRNISNCQFNIENSA